jgi:uncharacterized protein (TIGR00304 family)
VGDRGLNANFLSETGFALIILGVVLAFVAVILLSVRSQSSGSKTRAGGVILIGPIPIIFGTDRESAKSVLVLAIVLMVAVLVIMIVLSLLGSR